MEDARKESKTSMTLKYDNKMLVPAEQFLTPAQGVTATIKDDNGLVCIELTSNENTGSFELATLEFTAAAALDSARDTVIVCEEAQLESDGKTERFCCADTGVAIKPGLCLSVERLCRGYDTLFTVTDAGGLPIAGAKICERKNNTEYAGRTDAQGRLSVAGVSSPDTGTKLDLYARKANRFSATARYSVSNDLGIESPENINVTCGKNCAEISVTWQTGVRVTGGFIQYALKTPDKTDLATEDIVRKAERINNFSTHMGESCEMNGYSVCLTGLKPGAEYLYKVGTGDFWSETQVFKTIPAEGDFSFAVLADTHNVCGKAMRTALKSDPDVSFFAHAGDFVSAGGVYDDWQKYFADAGGLHAVYPTVSVSGNHDLSDGTGANYRLTHSNPANGVAGAPKGLYYYTEVNNTLFILAGDGYGDDAAIMDWMSEIIRNTAMKWKIVITHEGPYTCFINSASEEIKWGNFFNTAGIDMLISGHDHTYQRATIKDHKTLDVGGVISSSAGVTYLQCATSGGASNHDWAQHRSIWNAVYDSKTPSVTILRVSDEKIQVKALCVADNAEGFEVYDRFEMTK
jgi:predicted phosphodiesterase